MPTITPEWLFAKSDIEQGGLAEWGQPINEAKSGVYVVMIDNPPIDGQHVIYIGRAKSLSRRLRQFYVHKYGAKSPHRGGQEILTLDGVKVVHWARAEVYAEAERRMMEAFRAEAGGWPYGNRMKSARMTPTSN